MFKGGMGNIMKQAQEMQERLAKVGHDLEGCSRRLDAI